MSFAFTFSDDEESDGVSEIVPTPSSSKLHAKEEDLITHSGEFDPIKNELFSRTMLIKDVTSYTDVIHGLYEGGLKLWECSDDLLSYLQSETDKKGFIGQRAIDVGCGHGHPGIWCLTRGASLVCFQDLNIDALSSATAPNILNICGSQHVIKRPIVLTQSGKKNGDEEQPSVGVKTAIDTKKIAENAENDVSLAKLEELIQSNIHTGATSSVSNKPQAKKKSSQQDLLHYERIKALVLSGEEQDPEMLEWLIEIEQEMANEEESDAQDGKNHSGKQQSTQTNTKVIQNQGYSLPNENAILQPHGTLIYGPWGQYNLEIAMLQSNIHHLQQSLGDVQIISPQNDEIRLLDQIDDDNDSVGQSVDTNSTKLSTFQSNCPIFNFSSLTENSQSEANASITNNEDELLCQLLILSAKHFSNIPSQNSKLSICLNISHNGNDNVQFSISTGNQVDNVKELFSSLSLTEATDVIMTTSTQTQPNLLTLELDITPALINIIVIDNNEYKNMQLVNIGFKFVLKFAEIWNAIFSNLLQNLSQSSPDIITPLIEKLTPNGKKYKNPNYPYTIQSIHSPDYKFSTIISTTTSSRYFNLLTQLGLVETSWNEPNEGDRIIATPMASSSSLTSTTVIENGKNNEHFQQIQTTNLSTPQYSNVITTFARPFVYDPIRSTPEFSTQINNLQSTFLFSPLQTIPTALSFTATQSQLFYGSHPMNSPFRYKTILSSDTIYSCPTMPILIQTIRSLLHIDGKALIGAKRYYFGVGGSTAEFGEHITLHCPDLKLNIVKVFMDGASNIREILEITWNKDMVSQLW
jgi:hypothetical protein